MDGWGSPDQHADQDFARVRGIILLGIEHVVVAPVLLRAESDRLVGRTELDALYVRTILRLRQSVKVLAEEGGPIVGIAPEEVRFANLLRAEGIVEGACVRHEESVED